MAGPRWDYYQNINAVTHWVEWPQGPLSTVQDPLNKDEIPTWIEAWVLQSSTSTAPVQGVFSTGASQATRQRAGWPPDYSRWTADGPPPGWINGQFQPLLPAVGIALLATTTPNPPNPPTNRFLWWVEVIVLY